VDVESTCEFEKEGSKRTQDNQGHVPRSKDARWYEAGREKVCMCVCMAMGWRCVSCLILLAGESRQDENEIRRKRGKCNTTSGTSWPCLGDTRGLEFTVLHMDIYIGSGNYKQSRLGPYSKKKGCSRLWEMSM